MKNKIYSKLFKFCEIKSWQKEGTDKIISEYYNYEYRLEFKCDELGWFYKVYRGRYCGTATHSGLITLNIGGKILFTLVLSIIASLILWQGFKVTNYPDFIGIVICSFILSFFAFSIFNWSIYQSLRKAQYYIRNANKIRAKENDELIRQEIIGVVNKKIESNPKLARKTKLIQLKKKSFLGKLFDKEE